MHYFLIPDAMGSSTNSTPREGVKAGADAGLLPPAGADAISNVAINGATGSGDDTDSTKSHSSKSEEQQAASESPSPSPAGNKVTVTSFNGIKDPQRGFHFLRDQSSKCNNGVVYHKAGAWKASTVASYLDAIQTKEEWA